MRQEYGVRLYTSPRKTLTISVTAGKEVVVRAPLSFRKEGLEEILAQHDSWIRKELRRQEEAGERKKPFQAMEKIYYRGRELPVIRIPGKLIRQEEEAFLLGWEADLAAFLRRDTAAAAQELAEKWAWAARPRVLRYRRMRSRWGSCTPAGAITLNIHLIQAPPLVLEYVYVHELAHLRHPHHGKAFWAQVADWFPRYREAKDWLKAYGSFLFLSLDKDL